MVSHMFKSSGVFLGLIYSMFVIDVYGLVWRIIYVSGIALHCKFIVPLAKHRIIINAPIYFVSYLYLWCLMSMTLSPTYICGQLGLYYRKYDIFKFVLGFLWRNNSQSTVSFIRIIISQPNINWPGL